MGRPTKYNKKIAEKICSLIATDTYTVAEVCRMVKISDSTYYDWITRFPEFSENIKKAEAERMAFFVAEAKKSLLRKIQGYTVQEKHITLTNGEPENWKNRQNNEVTGKDGKDLFGQLTDEELDARIAELERKLGK